MSRNQSLDLENPPSLLRIREAAEYTGVGRSSLQNVYSYLHVLELPSQSRLLSFPYLAGAVAFGGAGVFRRHPTDVARAFAQMPAAHVAIVAAEMALELRLQQGLQAAVPASGILSPEQLATALFVTRATVSDWIKRGQLEVQRGKKQSLHSGVHIPEASARQVFSWHRPEGYVWPPAEYGFTAEDASGIVRGVNN